MAEITERLSTALADRYKLEHRLGEGGMATVYLAEDLKHDRKVAVKVLRPELAAVLGAERFVQEIKTTANLQHPHILPLFDSGEADGFLYYVMPFIDGETLREKLNRETQFGIDEAVAITVAIADALDYAHRQNVIHRDIKPENILLHDGRPMVADFGIALAVSAAAGGRMTETGLSLGTPHYMSPEQATADKDLTNRADIYSLGSVFYEMLTGEPPHVGGSAQAIIMKIVTEPADPVTKIRKSVPPHVAAATAKSLEKLAADRFESAARFAEALTNPAFTLPTTQGAMVGGVAATGPWTRLSVVGWSAAALLLVTTLWGWLRPQPDVPLPVSRYSIAIPEEEALVAGFGSRVAVSPDGSRIVYMGGDEQSSRLLVRDLDQLHATPLAGSGAAQHPFFSPDGSRVGFFASGDLRVASLSGGPPMTLGDTGVGGTGGTWGSDGYLYLDGDLPGNGLVRVPEGGGASEPVTMTDSTRGEEGHLWPEALPGGRGVVFSVRRGGRSNVTEWDIAVADLATGNHTVLVRGVRARYATSGHLLYVTADGTLMGVPFDETTLALTGDPIALVEGLRVGFLGSLDLAVSETGTLFYRTGSVGQEGLAEALWVTRDGVAEEINPGWVGDIGWPVLSPDGTRLAVNILANSEQQIWIRELDRGPLPKLTFTGWNQRPAWTPDGRFVAFGSRRTGDLDLYIRRADGTGQAELLLDEEEGLGEVTFSPDGEWLVYRVNRGGRDLFARRIGADLSVDSVPVPLVTTEFSETSPAVSPDGRWLAYISNESGQYQVYVRPFPNTDDGRWQISTDGGREPVWAHSGRELFYKEGADLMVVDVLPGATFVTGERRVLFPVQGHRWSVVHQFYDVTPDDQRFVMIRDRGAEQLGELIVVENFFEELKAKVGR
jgi:serine/threonine-protein kinase